MVQLHDAREHAGPHGGPRRLRAARGPRPPQRQRRGRSEPQPLLRDDPRFQDDADDRYADDALRDDWAAIHLEAGNDDAALFDDDDDDDDDAAPWPPAAAWVDDNDVDVVSVGASEWEEITATAFEVDTQVIEDTVLKGRWSVKNGRTVFERDDDAAA